MGGPLACVAVLALAAAGVSAPPAWRVAYVRGGDAAGVARRCRR